MKAGDYVRILTMSGQSKIAKLEKIDNICITDNGAVDINNIIKSSPNIIDLIKVGDFVNGKEVLEIKKFGSFNGIKVFGDIYYNKEIKSIVTKEQFEAIQYKIGGNDV